VQRLPQDEFYLCMSGMSNPHEYSGGGQGANHRMPRVQSRCDIFVGEAPADSTVKNKLGSLDWRNYFLILVNVFFMDSCSSSSESSSPSSSSNLSTLVDAAEKRMKKRIVESDFNTIYHKMNFESKVYATKKSGSNTIAIIGVSAITSDADRGLVYMYVVSSGNGNPVILDEPYTFRGTMLNGTMPNTSVEQIKIRNEW